MDKNGSIDKSFDSDTSFKMYYPHSLILYACFYSPTILILGILFLSITFQNSKGIIYLLFLIASLLGRELVYFLCGSNPNQENGSICTSVEYSIFGNACFSSFVFAFTILYLSIPMFSNGNPNYWLFFSLIVYFFVDIGIKMYKGCIINEGDLFINIVLGGGLASAIVMSLYAGKSSQFLFFNEVSSNKDVCSMPSKQTFKCQMYKDGTLVGNV